MCLFFSSVVIFADLISGASSQATTGQTSSTAALCSRSPSGTYYYNLSSGPFTHSLPSQQIKKQLLIHRTDSVSPRGYNSEMTNYKNMRRKSECMNGLMIHHLSQNTQTYSSKAKKSLFCMLPILASPPLGTNSNTKSRPASPNKPCARHIQHHGRVLSALDPKNSRKLSGISSHPIHHV